MWHRHEHSYTLIWGDPSSCQAPCCSGGLRLGTYASLGCLVTCTAAHGYATPYAHGMSADCRPGCHVSGCGATSCLDTSSRAPEVRNGGAFFRPTHAASTGCDLICGRGIWEVRFRGQRGFVLLGLCLCCGTAFATVQEAARAGEFCATRPHPGKESEGNDGILPCRRAITAFAYVLFSDCLLFSDSQHHHA